MARGTGGQVTDSAQQHSPGCAGRNSDLSQPWPDSPVANASMMARQRDSVSKYSCSSACVTGLLASSCEQCGGSDACGSFALSGGVLQAAECVVDAAL